MLIGSKAFKGLHDEEGVGTVRRGPEEWIGGVVARATKCEPSTG